MTIEEWNAKRAMVERLAREICLTHGDDPNAMVMLDDAAIVLTSQGKRVVPDAKLGWQIFEDLAWRLINDGWRPTEASTA